VNEEEPARFTTEIDAQDSIVDEEITAAPTRAHPIPQPPLVNIPPGTYRKSEEQGPG
jgi:hypothetical protein